MKNFLYFVGLRRENKYFKLSFGIFIILLFFQTNALALEIVYPKTNPAKINANSTFFIGSTKPDSKLKINDIDVTVFKTGAFAQVVPLKCGKNIFKVSSNNDSIDFIIERPQTKAAQNKQTVLIEYPALNFNVENDNSPLRMTPIDCGINRMAHLPKDTKLLINGEKGDFYRVFLNTQLTGWIAKSDVKQTGKIPNLTTLKEIKTREDKEFCYYELDLNNKIPFSIKEEKGLTVQLFNIFEQVDNTYCINLPLKKLIGYDALYEENNKFILKVRKVPDIKKENPLKDVIIAVDAGHGGKEFGAIGGFGDKEKDINLAIAKNLQKELETRGAKVVMTRNNDSTISLNDRIQKAKDKDSMLLISIHSNALPDGQNPLKSRGTSVYYYHPQAKALADSIINSMTTELGMQNDRVRQGSLALVRPTSSVSVLIEVGYIINPDDYAMLLDKCFQSNCAKAIADGIEKYIYNLPK